MRILSFITEASVVRKIRDHLQSTHTDPARGPPRVDAEPADRGTDLGALLS